MFRSWERWTIGVLIVGFTLIPALSLAQEHAGQEHAGQAAAPAKEHGGTAEHGGAATAPAAGLEAPAPAAPAAAPAAPEATPVTPMALRPITITFTGETVSLVAPEPASATPAEAGAPVAAGELKLGELKLRDRYGVEKVIAVGPDVKVLPEGKTLQDIKPGDKLTAEYEYDVATGKRTARSLTIGEAAKE